MRWTHALLGLPALLTACVSAPLINIETNSSVHFEARMGGQCTAFHIGEGQVLTAGHCAVQFGMFVEHQSAMLQWINLENDVALLFVPALTEAPFSSLACRAPRVGEHIVVIGDTTWATDIYTFGRVSTKPEVRLNDLELLLLDLIIAPGNSGAPVYATDGRIIAMVVGLVT